MKIQIRPSNEANKKVLPYNFKVNAPSELKIDSMSNKMIVNQYRTFYDYRK